MGYCNQKLFSQYMFMNKRSSGTHTSVQKQCVCGILKSKNLSYVNYKAFIALFFGIIFMLIICNIQTSVLIKFLLFDY